MCASEWLRLTLRNNSKSTTWTDIRTPDDVVQEVPKHVGGCVSIVFTFQCMYGLSDKLNLRTMNGRYKIKIFRWISKIAYDLWNCEFQCV
jgi:hypothetical protein